MSKNMRSLIYIVLIVAVALVAFTPKATSAVEAQDQNVWLPLVVRDIQRLWFTFAELADAVDRLGYANQDEFWPEIVNCAYYPGSDPEVLIQLWACTLPVLDANGDPVARRYYYFTFDPETDQVEWEIIEESQE